MKSENDALWKEQLKRLPLLLLIPLGLLIPKIAVNFPQFIETYYSGRIYLLISGFIGMLTRWFPGSLAEVLLLITAASLVFSFLKKTIKLIFERGYWVRYVTFLLSLCVAVGVLLNLFYGVWGLNYFRPTLYKLMDLPVEARPVEELEALCYRLTDSAKTLRAEVVENKDGVFALEDGYRTYFRQIPAAYEALGKENPLFAAKVYPAKSVYFSVGLSYANIVGIYFPYTAECNVNTDQPALLMLSGAAHETAHFLGFSREDEANFIAYLCCLHSDNPSIAYSGTMSALIYCANQLYKSDSGKYRALYATYSEGMIRDLKDYSAYWDQFKGPVQESFDSVNDNYLKFNKQESGIKSYGMMVDLMLSYYAN